MVIEIAKEKGIKSITGSVDLSASNPERSLLMMINNGYRIYHNKDNGIYFYKRGLRWQQ